MNDSESAPFTIETLSNFDMKIIKGVPWAEDMYKVVEGNIRKIFLNWIDVVLTLSKNEEDINEWKNIFIDNISEAGCEMVKDIQVIHAKVVISIENSFDKIEGLAKSLNTELPKLSLEETGLYPKSLELKQHIRQLEKQLEEKQNELNKLLRKHTSLCQALGKDPNNVQEPALLVDKIVFYEKIIDELEQERFQLNEKFFIWSDEIIAMAQELQYEPKTSFETSIIKRQDQQVTLTEVNMKALEKFYYKMKTEYKNFTEEICDLRNKIENLWDLLEVEFIYREEIRQKSKGNSIKTLQVLRKENGRCKELKMANLKKFIHQAREKIVALWEECQCSQNDKDAFEWFHSDHYNEDLLQLHELCLDKWQAYAEENKEILSLLNKHRQYWKKLVELEEPTNPRDRFNNRGGKLLLEEKERKKLKSLIPKVEENLLDLARKYESLKNREFYTYGETVEEYIHNLHAEKENIKKEKCTARKAQRNTPGFPSTSKAGSTMGSMMCPKTTPRKRLFQSKNGSVAKKMKHEEYASTDSKVMNTRKRLSMERKKRLNKIRKSIRHINVSSDATFVTFRNDLNSREDIRSTLVTSDQLE
ncbi:unnamed protein product [Phyllotreta striolata]|uniref:Protein regulator of cytokinesis 1 n=1 Tax=Phyllotreta striolata TaxID=444603 RepID=A0A9N9TEH0_PHYSR|nr:unnamed protein product [Phyllotreta striolata]